METHIWKKYQENWDTTPLFIWTFSFSEQIIIATASLIIICKVWEKKLMLCPNSGASWITVHPESGPKAEGRMLLQKQAACLQKCVPGLAMPLLAVERGTALDNQHLPMALPIFVNWYSSETDVDKKGCSETSPIGTWELCVDLVIRGHKVQAGWRGSESLCQLW